MKFKIDRSRFTNIIGIEIENLKLNLGYSANNKRPLGLSRADLDDYRCFIKDTKTYIPFLHLNEYLIDVQHRARRKTTKTKATTLLQSNLLEVLETIQEVPIDNPGYLDPSEIIFDPSSNQAIIESTRVSLKDEDTTKLKKDISTLDCLELISSLLSQVLVLFDQAVSIERQKQK